MQVCNLHKRNGTCPPFPLVLITNAYSVLLNILYYAYLQVLEEYVSKIEGNINTLRNLCMCNVCLHQHNTDKNSDSHGGTSSNRESGCLTCVGTCVSKALAYFTSAELDIQHFDNSMYSFCTARRAECA